MRGILAFIAGMTSVLLAAPPGLLVTEAHAQQETATVIGTVRDSQQAALPGATITVKNVDTGFTRTSISDDQGRYRIAAIPPGAYELSAELAGFGTAIRKGVTLTLGAEAVLNFELAVASVTEQVSVTADTPVIETTTAAVQGTMRREQIDLLPVTARDYTNVIRLMPGAAANNATYGFAGSRGRSNTWNVDGVDNSDEISGYAHQSPALDSIQEIQVLANGFKAEYGQASGGVINVITRSGTNQLRGSGFALFQDESLRARSPYANRSQPEDPFQRIQYGATIGGPIQRDKMHFFGTYEREDRDTTSISTRTLPAVEREFLGGDASVPAGGGRRPGAVRRGRRAAARAAGVRRRPQGDRARRSAAQLESVLHRALAARRQEGAVRLQRHALRLQRLVHQPAHQLRQPESQVGAVREQAQ